jgi:hypothetical protein
MIDGKTVAIRSSKEKRKNDCSIEIKAFSNDIEFDKQELEYTLK